MELLQLRYFRTVAQYESITKAAEHYHIPQPAMSQTIARLEKELNNKVNRRCNCDDANTSKVVEAAQEQLTAIRHLESLGLLEQLPQKLQAAAKARVENPESSLTELASMMEPPITKPAMNHRLKKLVAASKES